MSIKKRKLRWNLVKAGVSDDRVDDLISEIEKRIAEQDSSQNEKNKSNVFNDLKSLIAYFSNFDKSRIRGVVDSILGGAIWDAVKSAPTLSIPVQDAVPVFSAIHTHPDGIWVASTDKMSIDIKHALKISQQCVSYAENKFGYYSNKNAEALNCLSFALDLNNMYHKAIKLKSRIVEIKEKQHGKMYPSIAAATANTGISFFYLGEHEQAHDRLQNPLHALQSSFDEPHIDVVLTLCAISKNFDAIGNFQESLKYQEEAMDLAARIPGCNHKSTPDVWVKAAMGMSFWVDVKEIYVEHLGMQDQIPSWR